MPKISIGDAELYYEDTGQGETLLLVPGLSGRGSFWAGQVPDLARALMSPGSVRAMTGRVATSRR